MTAPAITVVAAVIERNGCFLVTERPAGVHLEGLWEFPGGKVGPGESHADALRREIREELAAHVDVHEPVFDVVHEYAGRRVALYFYRCTLAGDPVPQLGQALQWVPRRDLPRLGFPPADAELIRRLSASADP